MSGNCTTIHALMLFFILSLLLAHDHHLFSISFSFSKPTKQTPTEPCSCNCPTVAAAAQPTAVAFLLAFLSGVLFSLLCLLTIRFPPILKNFLRSAAFLTLNLSRSCLCCIKRRRPPPPPAPTSLHRQPSPCKGGISDGLLKTLPTFAYSAEQRRRLGRGAGVCAICLSEFLNEQTLRWLPDCDHLFHRGCIDAWLGSHTSCPCCRANLDGSGDGIDKGEILPLQNGVITGGGDGGDADLDVERRIGCEGGAIGGLLRLLVGRRRQQGRRQRHR